VEGLTEEPAMSRNFFPRPESEAVAFPTNFSNHNEDEATTESVMRSPILPPRVRIVAQAGRCVTLELSDVESVLPGAKPDGVAGATVLSCAGGDAPPSDLDAWTFACSTSRTTFNVQLGATTAPGAAVWLTAFWFNPREESGPASEPVATRVQLDVPALPPTRRLAA
jgi:hypothetical protein